MNWRSWFVDRSGPNWPRILLVALSCTLLVTVGVAGATSTTTFGPYNPSWDGASALREEVDTNADVETEFVSATSRYEAVDANETVAFVIAPDERYSNQDVERLRQFVADGGTLVVLEDYGESGNDLLADLGTRARIDGRILKDERNHYRGPTMPVATGVGNHTLTAGVDRLTLNYASAVQPGNATVLVRSSEFAYLATDEEDQLGDDDELAAYPVATVESLGDGEVVVVADPSITINAMLEQPDNAAFLSGLYARQDRVLFDISHNTGLPPLTSAVLTARESPPVQIGLGTLTIAGFVLLSRRRVWPRLERVRAGLPIPDSRDRPREESPVMSDEQRAQYLRERHPDWDEERIERVTKALNRPDSQPTDTDE